MADGSTSTLILFITAVVIASAVAGTLTTTVMSLSNNVDERGDAVADQLSTDITIISDPGSTAIYDDGTETTTLLVKNTGSRTLVDEPGSVEVLIDGEYVMASSVTVVSGDSSWRPGAVVEVTIDGELTDGDHRAVVIYDQIRDDIRFFT
jgi:flagellar protein FlaG